jgi:hypothetical protein
VNERNLDGEHAELGLARAGDLAERPAVGHERDGGDHLPVVGRDQQLGRGGAPLHVA